MKRAKSKQPSNTLYPPDWETYLYDSHLTLALTPPHAGWIALVLIGTPRGACTVISCSNVFDPLPDLVKWLHEIAASRLPSEMEVDEEGCSAFLQALAVPGRPDWIELRIERESARDEGREMLFHSRVERKQMVREFCRRWEEWGREEYLASQWNGHGVGEPPDDGDASDDPRRISIGALRSFADVARRDGRGKGKSASL